MSTAAYTVGHQANLIAAGGLALRWVALGLAWSWLIPLPEELRLPRLSRWVVAVARASICGLLFSLLAAWALAEASWFSPGAERMLLAGVAGAGLLLGGAIRKAEMPAHLLEGLPGLVFVAAAFAGLLALPDRGEWIAGGWDPGIYVGEGMRVEREGTFHPVPEPFLATLTDEEWPLFTREQPAYGFTEYLPVVPIDKATARIQPFFFRLTSTAIAVAARCGGLHAATRINLLLGLLTALMMAGLFLVHRQPGVVCIAAMLLLVLHPIWLFMANFPTSEMLQLFWILALAFLLPFRFQGRAVGWIMAGILFAGMLNRFSFLPFAALFVCAMAWMDLPRTHRDVPFRQRLLLLTAVLAGAWVDFLFCRVTLDRLGPHLPPMLVVGLLASVVAILTEALALVPAWRGAVTKVGERTLALLLLGGTAILLVGDIWPAFPWNFHMIRSAREALPFLGPFWLAAALVGLLVVAFRGGTGRSLPGVLFFLVGGTIGTLAFLSIAPLYPWAARRFLEFTVPALSLSVALLFGALWTAPSARTVWRGAALLLVAGVLGSTARQSRDAWRHTEFNGLSTMIGEAARHVNEGDVVVADHFRWGTPLRQVYGRQVLNGEVWWQDGDAASTAAALHVLAAYRGDGRRILFFTSTDAGLSVFAAPIAPVEVLWDSGPVTIRELGHRIRQRRFRPVDKEKRFQLMEWTGSGP